MKTKSQILIDEIEKLIDDDRISPAYKASMIDELIMSYRLDESKILTDIDQIELFVCNISKCKVSDLKTNSRRREIVYARGWIFLILVNYLDMNTIDSGNLVNRSRAMYYWYVEEFKNYFKTDKDFKNQFIDIHKMYGDCLFIRKK